MLTNREKDDLYTIIASVLGDDHTIRQYKSQFNDRTVGIVEDAVNASVKCNSNMKEFVIALLGGASLATRGWLKRSIKEFSKLLKDKGMTLNGYGCLVGTKSRWKSAIITSTI